MVTITGPENWEWGKQPNIIVSAFKCNMVAILLLITKMQMQILWPSAMFCVTEFCIGHVAGSDDKKYATIQSIDLA